MRIAIVQIQALIAPTSLVACATLADFFHLANSLMLLTHVFVPLLAHFARDCHSNVSFSQRSGGRFRNAARQFPMMTRYILIAFRCEWTSRESHAWMDIFFWIIALVFVSNQCSFYLCEVFLQFLAGPTIVSGA